MTTVDKKPLIIVSIVGLIAVLVMVGGVALGGGGTVGNGGWRDRLTGFRSTAALTPQDFTVGDGNCQIGPTEILVTGQCMLTIDAASLFAFGSATRRATLTVPAPTSPVAVQAVVENTAVSRLMQPADTVDLIFGRSGGTLQLTCEGAPSCRVTLDNSSSGG